MESQLPSTHIPVVIGIGAGLLWVVIASQLIPPSDGFQIAFRELPNSSTGNGYGVITVIYVVLGPILVVGSPVALVLRYGLVTPLLVALVEVGTTLVDPGRGDFIGTAASLLWPVGVLAIAILAVIELAVRKHLLPTVLTTV